MKINNTLLRKEAKAFDKLVKKRIKDGFIPDINLKQNFLFFKNNPWKFVETQKISITSKINFVIKNTKKNMKCLDIGSGLGTLSFQLARKKRYVHGIDISQNSITFSKKYINNKNNLKKFCKFSNISLQNLKLDEKYDRVIFFKTLHHLPNISAVLNKCHSLLKKNGKILIVEPLRNNFNLYNAIICYLIRILFKKQKIKLNENNITKDVEKILFENLYVDKNNKKQQSPMDNVSSSEYEIKKKLEKKFIIQNISYTDAIKDKLIGQLNKKQLDKELKFLINFEKYLINKSLLKGVTVQIVAKKK